MNIIIEQNITIESVLILILMFCHLVIEIFKFVITISKLYIFQLKII